MHSVCLFVHVCSMVYKCVFACMHPCLLTEHFGRGLLTTDQTILTLTAVVFRSGAAAAGNSLFGRSADPVLLRGLRCGGTESHLLSCQADRIVGAASDCSASSEAGVICGDFLPCR